MFGLNEEKMTGSGGKKLHNKMLPGQYSLQYYRFMKQFQIHRRFSDQFSVDLLLHSSATYYSDSLLSISLL
jgi:hypothetical protein